MLAIVTDPPTAERELRALLPGVDVRARAPRWISRAGIARHEAGHAVAALALGCPVVAAAVWDGDGFTMFDPSFVPVRELATFFMAGAVGQRISWLGVHDAANVVAIAQLVDEDPVATLNRGAEKARVLLARHRAAHAALARELARARCVERQRIEEVVGGVAPGLVPQTRRSATAAAWGLCRFVVGRRSLLGSALRRERRRRHGATA